MRIHNAFIEDSIILSNSIPERPLFSLILGDIVDSQGERENFEVMQRYWEYLDSPVLYELGNHESKYSSTFEPGYDMSAFNNYFAAQKKVNGMEKILYSFNVGQWHFVVWPDPLRSPTAQPGVVNDNDDRSECSGPDRRGLFGFGPALTTCRGSKGEPAASVLHSPQAGRPLRADRPSRFYTVYNVDAAIRGLRQLRAHARRLARSRWIRPSGARFLGSKGDAR